MPDEDGDDDVDSAEPTEKRRRIAQLRAAVRAPKIKEMIKSMEDELYPKFFGMPLPKAGRRSSAEGGSEQMWRRRIPLRE